MTEFSGAPDDQLPPMPDIPQQLLPAAAALGGLMRDHHPNILLDAFVAAVPTEIMADYLAAQPRELLVATLKKISSDRLSEVLNELPCPEPVEVKEVLAENEDLAVLLRHVGKLNDPTTVAKVALANLAGNQRNRTIAELGRVELVNALSWMDGADQAWVRDGLVDNPIAEVTDEETLADSGAGRHVLIDGNDVEFHTQFSPPTTIVQYVKRDGHRTTYTRNNVPPVTEVGPGGRNVVLHAFTEVKS